MESTKKNVDIFKKRVKRILLLLTMLIVCIIIGELVVKNIMLGDERIFGYNPVNGMVPNKETAIKIAEAVWLPVYGDSIYEEKPFIAEYVRGKGYWYVHGSLPKASEHEIVVGGVAEIRIRKSNGQIIYLYHGQ